MTDTQTKAAEILDYFNEHAEPAKTTAPDAMRDIRNRDGIVAIGEGIRISQGIGEIQQIDPNSPNAVPCPRCHRITGRDSTICLCGCNPKYILDEEDRRRRENRVSLIAMAFLGSGMGLFYLFRALDILVMPWLAAPVGLMGFGLLLLSTAQRRL